MTEREREREERERAREERARVERQAFLILELFPFLVLQKKVSVCVSQSINDQGRCFS